MDSGSSRARRAAEAARRAASIRAVMLDVDGTLTDGTIWIGQDGEAMKGFSVHDGFGLTLLRDAGIRLAIVTGRRSRIVEARAAELKIGTVIQGVGDKAAALRELAARFALPPTAIACIGDDWPDLPAFALAGLAAAPAGASAPVLAAAHWVSTRSAGQGAVREFAEWLLAARGELDALLARYLRGGSPGPQAAPH
ncbi:MAG: KdsC family phosphatase [Gammaproteobacteria bacterium]|jgi:3-deoxy-D-manno-octulosonate 8-phosphate phosphatase (KDO 8-P phosphatase)